MIMQTNKTSFNQANCFDFLRFFFAFQILFYHISVLSQNEKLAFLSILFNANIAVKGFFIISGFLVAKSYKNTATLKLYFIKRIKRILPAYLAVVFLSSILLFFVSDLSFNNYFFNLEVYKYFGWNSVFMNFMHPCLPGVFTNNLMCAVNGSLWTLKVEEGFYLVLPLIFYLIFKTRNTFLILVTLYIMSFLYFYIFEYYYNLPTIAKQLPGYLSYFSSGIFLFIFFEKVYQRKKMLLFTSLALLIITYNINPAYNILFPISFAVFTITVAYSFPIANNFGKYGDFTYGLYIYHFPIIQIFKQYNLFEKYNPFLMTFFVLLLSFLFALFSWFFIEKRFLDRYKNKLKNAS